MAKTQNHKPLAYEWSFWRQKLAVYDWISKLKKLIESLKREDIFNNDETGLFIKCMPQKTVNILQLHSPKMLQKRTTSH